MKRWKAFEPRAGDAAGIKTHERGSNVSELLPFVLEYLKPAPTSQSLTAGSNR